MNPNTYWLFDTDEEMVETLHKLEEELKESHELTFGVRSIYAPRGSHVPTTQPYGGLDILEETPAVTKPLEKDKSDCEYHKWVHVGESPFSGEQWFNCEKCNISKEKHEKNIRDKKEAYVKSLKN